MGKILSIVETAYRGTLEEQDDTVLWLTHMLKNAGAEITVLLQGNAVNYLAKGQDASGLSFGALKMHRPPQLDHDIAALIAKDVEIVAIEEDIRDRGLTNVELISGFKRVNRAGVADLLEQHEQVWRW